MFQCSADRHRLGARVADHVTGRREDVVVGHDADLLHVHVSVVEVECVDPITHSGHDALSRAAGVKAVEFLKHLAGVQVEYARRLLVRT